jgi:hypothetical protein
MSTPSGGGGIRAVERARLAPTSAAAVSRPAWRFRFAPTAGTAATAAAAATAATVAAAVGLVAATAVARAYGTHAASGPIGAPAFPHVEILRGVGSCQEGEVTPVAVLKTPREGKAPDFLRRKSMTRRAVDPEGGTRGNFLDVLKRVTGEYETVLKAAIAASGHDVHGEIHLVIHPLLTLLYHHGAELDARAFYAAFAALPAAISADISWKLDVCMLDGSDDAGFDRYARAFAAARRVCEYRRPNPRRSMVGAFVGSVDLVSHSRAPMHAACAVARSLREGAVQLCVGSNRAGIMVAADGGRPARGLVNVNVASRANGGGGYFSVDFDAVMREEHETQEEVAVSAWMRGECEAGDGGDSSDSTDSSDSGDGGAGRDSGQIEARMDQLFNATIAHRWGHVRAGSDGTDTIQGVDYTKTTSAADFGDAWVVRDAKLRRAGTDATAALVFVIGPNARSGDGSRFFVECVRVAVRAGLDAMIREGVGLALVTRFPEGACSAAEFVSLVNELLNEEVAYVDDGPSGPSGRGARLTAARGRYFEAVLVPLGGLCEKPDPGFGGMRAGLHRFV